MIKNIFENVPNLFESWRESSSKRIDSTKKRNALGIAKNREKRTKKINGSGVWSPAVKLQNEKKAFNLVKSLLICI